MFRKLIVPYNNEGCVRNIKTKSFSNKESLTKDLSADF